MTVMVTFSGCGTHIEGYGWMEAGWKVETVNSSKKRVRLIRAG